MILQMNLENNQGTCSKRFCSALAQDITSLVLADSAALHSHGLATTSHNQQCQTLYIWHANISSHPLIVMRQTHVTHMRECNSAMPPSKSNVLMNSQNKAAVFSPHTAITAGACSHRHAAECLSQSLLLQAACCLQI
jgi:hypothetical protein